MGMNPQHMGMNPQMMGNPQMTGQMGHQMPPQMMHPGMHPGQVWLRYDYDRENTIWKFILRFW